jgi:hypothetical protein
LERRGNGLGSSAAEKKPSKQLEIVVSAGERWVVVGKEPHHIKTVFSSGRTDWLEEERESEGSKTFGSPASSTCRWGVSGQEHDTYALLPHHHLLPHVSSCPDPWAKRNRARPYYHKIMGFISSHFFVNIPSFAK